MSNRRVKALEYDDDDLGYDDYDEEGQQDELSNEDKEQLRLGTIEVRKQLGPAYDMFVGDSEIQDALWNYYYDIGKSVAYIKGKHKPKQVAKAPPSQAYNLQSAKQFFEDCPWGQIPHHRQAIIEPPVLPQGGLLGGASQEGGKMSKLAALAAKRRQKEALRENETTVSVDCPQDEYAQRLNALSISNRPKERRSSAKDKSDLDILEPPNSLPVTASKDDVSELEKDDTVATRTTPSTFGGILADALRIQHVNIDPAMLKMPGTFDFKDPSPDDIVYRAQTGQSR